MTQPQTNKRRVLIIGADGLRPDMLDPELMPTVTKLANEGVRFFDHHAVYPTHTRVNMSSLATGTSPGQHGLVANTMLVPFATDDHIINTSDYQHLDALAATNNGQALLRPTLSDLLAKRGERLAVAATSTPGASLLWTHNQPYRLINPNSAFGQADLYDLREKLGKVPKIGSGPQVAQLDYARRAVTDIYLDDPDNRVILLWMSEPDMSQHHFGLGSDEAKQALQAVDQNVGTILRTMEERGLRDQFDVFFISDHGHSTVQAHRTLGEYLAQAAQEIGPAWPAVTTASDYIYGMPGQAEPTATMLEPLVEWLLAQDWLGVLFGGRADLALLPGVIPLQKIWNDASNSRRPLLAISPQWSHIVNAAGVPGQVSTLTTQAALKSSHGSASPYDMHALCIAHGPTFQAGQQSSLPSGALDVLPTVLTLLDMPKPDHLDGRVLWEAFRQPQGESGLVKTEIIEPENVRASAGSVKIQLERVGQTSYLHGAL